MTAVIVFAKNEEKTIGRVIDDLKAACRRIPGGKFQLFLCDDSTDQTAKIARDKGLFVIKGPGRGLGMSYYYALRFVSKRDFSVIVTVDGDGQADMSEIPRFYERLEKGALDMIIGSRFLKKDSVSYRYPKTNLFGVRILSFFITVGARQKFTDSHGGLRVMKSAVAKDMDFLGTHSYVQETVIDACSRGFKVKELPSRWNKRIHGESRVLRSKIRYMSKMALPLLLRVKFHWLFAFLILTGLLFSRSFLLFSSLGLCVFLELYKLWTFKRNKKKRDCWLKSA